MRPTGPLFTQFELPGVNALTAGSFDASTSFDANTPMSHVAYSLGVLGMYLSPVDNARPDAIALQGQAPAPASGMKKCDEKSTWFDRITGRCCIGEVVNGECVMKSDGENLPNTATVPALPGILGGAGVPGLFSEDTGKRIGLFLIAITILAVALWKM